MGIGEIDEAARLAHILDHPEMVGLEAAIEETYPATRAGDKFVCVAVKVTGSDAFALTAYLTDKPKKGTVLWDANS